MQYTYDTEKEKYVADTSLAEDIKAIRGLMEKILEELRKKGEYVTLQFDNTQPEYLYTEIK